MGKSLLGVCPECESDILHVEIYSDIFSYKGTCLVVSNLERAVCSSCKSAPILGDMIKENHKKVIEAKRRQENLELLWDLMAKYVDSPNANSQCLPQAQRLVIYGSK